MPVYATGVESPWACQRMIFVSRGGAEAAEIVLLIDAPLLVPASFHGAAFHGAAFHGTAFHGAAFHGAEFHGAMEQNHPLIPSFSISDCYGKRRNHCNATYHHKWRMYLHYY